MEQAPTFFNKNMQYPHTNKKNRCWFIGGVIIILKAQCEGIWVLHFGT
jgi:hypothetical protein